jgi:hypothetical protein
MNALEIPTLETERLRLRPFAKSDLDDYAALYEDPEVLRYLSGGAAGKSGLHPRRRTYRRETARPCPSSRAGDAVLWARPGNPLDLACLSSTPRARSHQWRIQVPSILTPCPWRVIRSSSSVMPETAPMRWSRVPEWRAKRPKV